MICNRGFGPPPTGCLRRHSRAWVFHHRVQLHPELRLLFRRDRANPTIPFARLAPIRAILPLCFQATTNASLRITRIFMRLQMPGGMAQPGICSNASYSHYAYGGPQARICRQQRTALFFYLLTGVSRFPRAQGNARAYRSSRHARSQATRRLHEPLDADRFRSSADGWSCRRR